jgi:hypothetical protein
MRTIVLLTAGLGTRMGRYAELTNKSLLPIKGKAIISHIIDQYPRTQTRFIVALGHKADMVQAYLNWAHPYHLIEYVHIDNFAGPGSGPAYSLRQCRDAIEQNEFTVIACDGYYECLASIPTGRNVLGVAQVAKDQQPIYCNVCVRDGRVTDVYDKQATEHTSVAACGVWHIHAASQFFRQLNGVELSSGFAGLPMEAIEIGWRDLGSEAFYDAFLVEQHGSDSFDYSKDNELLYTVQVQGSADPHRRVIKLFGDATITEHRLLRAQGRDYFPEIDGRQGGMYTYRFVPGTTFYERNTPVLFDGLLEWLETAVWNKQPADAVLTLSDCHAFYWMKTQDRLAQFRKKYPFYAPQFINGREITHSAEYYLDKLNWKRLCGAELAERTAFIHGDLQFDNIVRTPSGEICLLDWRQDFAGQLWYGDKYYDIAKLMAGMIVNHDLIKRRAFFFEENEQQTQVIFDLPHRPMHEDMRRELASRYPDPMIEDIVTLIFLNMAALHRPPYDRLLFCLALHRLAGM